MTTKIYLPTDSLNLYTQTELESIPRLTVASRCSITTHSNDLIGVIDELHGRHIVEPTLFSDIQDEAGASIGATYAIALTYLSEIVG